MLELGVAMWAVQGDFDISWVASLFLYSRHR
jgi:hypothetical protein